MDVERTIVTLLITNTDFCKQVLPTTEKRYFETSWAQTVVGWVAEYFNIYGVAPDNTIKDIYGAKYDSLSLDDAELISAFLQNLSDTATAAPPNVEFHVSRTLDFYRKRALILLNASLTMCIDNGKYDAAEETLVDYKRIAKGATTWVKPSDFGGILERIITREENPLFRFQGDFGIFAGPMQAKWLVFWMGPPKRGKSNGLVETTAAALANNLKVCVFSHEMSELDWISRFINVLVPGADEAKDYLYPVFDCFLNATHNCRQPQRRGVGPCVVNGRVNRAYVPCQACKGEPGSYDPVICQQLRTVEAQTHEKRALMTVLLRKWKENDFRFIHYPPYSGSCMDMERELDRLAWLDRFFPHLVIDDYLGAHKCGDPRIVGRDFYDFEAKGLKNMADARNLLVFSAFQGTRGSIDKFRIGMGDTSEDIRIINHADKVITLNQTTEENHNGIMRFGKAADRHMKWYPDDDCTILQRLEHSKIILGSHRGCVKTYEQRIAENN